MENISFIVNEVISTIQDYLKSVFGSVETPFVKLQGKTKWLVNQNLFLEKTWQFINRIQDVINVSSAVCSEVDVRTSGQAGFHSEGCQTEELGDSWDTSMIQLTSSNKEIERRINKFIQRKQMELDVYNQREFSSIPEDPNASTCARTDAVDVPRRGLKSLVKVSNVSNSDESRDLSFCNRATDMTLLSSRKTVWEASHPSQALGITHFGPHIVERVENIKNHLDGIDTNPPEDTPDDTMSSCSVLQKIKSLERRILYLEGISPEYFDQKQQRYHWRDRVKNKSSKLLSREKQMPYPVQQTTFSDLDKRIATLRSILLRRGVDHND